MKHHVQIAAFLPMSLAAELRFDQFVEFRTRQGIGNAHADLIRPSGLEQVARRENIRQFLAQVAQLNEKSDADARGSESVTGSENLADRRPLVHGIQYALAAALGSDPSLKATRALQCLRHAHADQVRASLDREPYAPPCCCGGGGEVLHPVDAESEDVICKPNVLRIETALQICHFRCNGDRIALQI